LTNVDRTSAAGQPKLRAALAREIETLAAETGRRAVAGETPTADIERLKALQASLAALPAKRTGLASWAGLIGLLCLIVASAAWTVRVPRTRVQLDLVTASATAKLAGDLNREVGWRIAPDSLRLQHFTHLDLPPEYGTQPALEREGSLDLTVQGGNVRLRQFAISSGALVTLSRSDDGATDMVVRGAPFTCDFDVTGSIVASVGPGSAALLPAQTFSPELPPARFDFKYDGKSRVPAQLRDTPLDSLTVRDIAITGLGFFEERGDRSTSQILRGTVTMTDTGEHLTLAPEAALRLGNAQGMISTLQIGKDGVQVTFEGTAAEVTLGNGDFARNLKPTLLEWLYHQQTIGFLWGALSFIWGVGWSARKLFARGD